MSLHRINAMFFPSFVHPFLFSVYLFPPLKGIFLPGGGIALHTLGTGKYLLNKVR